MPINITQHTLKHTAVSKKKFGHVSGMIMLSNVFLYQKLTLVKVSAVKHMSVKTSGMCVNENELYVRVKIKVAHAKLKGSLHTTIFSKYTELLQLKTIFRIF